MWSDLVAERMRDTELAAGYTAWWADACQAEARRHDSEQAALDGVLGVAEEWGLPMAEHQARELVARAWACRAEERRLAAARERRLAMMDAALAATRPDRPVTWRDVEELRSWAGRARRWLAPRLAATQRLRLLADARRLAARARDAAEEALAIPGEDGLGPLAADAWEQAQDQWELAAAGGAGGWDR